MPVLAQVEKGRPSIKQGKIDIFMCQCIHSCAKYRQSKHATGKYEWTCRETRSRLLHASMQTNGSSSLTKKEKKQTVHGDTIKLRPMGLCNNWMQTKWRATDLGGMPLELGELGKVKHTKGCCCKCHYFLAWIAASAKPWAAGSRVSTLR